MIERTFNTKLVQSIFKTPVLLRRSGSTTEKVFNPHLQKDLYYLLALTGNEVLGVIVFHKQNDGCYQGHVNYLPEHWGEGLEKYTKEAIDWMFTNTECYKIFAFVPDRFPEIKRHSQLAGMKEEGRLSNSYHIGDTIYSQAIMGISK